VVLSAGSNVISGFVVSGASVYFGEGDDEGGPVSDAIEIAPVDPGEAGSDDARVIALGQPGAASFAADATHVYWTTHAPSATPGAADDCTIVSLAK
jgi:hypothetical protein